MDVSGNPAVQSLNIAGSSIATLDASGCDNLQTLDVSGCDELTTLDVSSTNITNLNVEGCTNLEELDCSYCKLNELNVSSCESLSRLDCSNNNLYRLDVGRLGNLNELKCDNQAIQQWNIGTSTEMYFLNFFHDDGVNGTGIENITNVRYKHNEDDENTNPAEYNPATGVVRFILPEGGLAGMVDYVYYDYVTGFQGTGSSSVSSAASGTVMQITIDNTNGEGADDGCNAGMTFPMLALVGLLLLRKR